jgi:hypothetical protein
VRSDANEVRRKNSNRHNNVSAKQDPFNQEVHITPSWDIKLCGAEELIPEKHLNRLSRKMKEKTGLIVEIMNKTGD